MRIAQIAPLHERVPRSFMAAPNGSFPRCSIFFWRCRPRSSRLSITALRRPVPPCRFGRMVGDECKWKHAPMRLNIRNRGRANRALLGKLGIAEPRRARL
jgi:hypothetical protein